MNDRGHIGIAEQSVPSDMARSELDVRSLLQSFLKWLAFAAGVLLTFAWAGVLLYVLLVWLF
jgi:hypothetical protein